MRNWVLLTAIAGLLMAAAPPVPPELASLEPLFQNEDALIDAVRTVEKSHRAMAEFEQNEADKAAKSNDAEKVKAHREAAMKHAALIRQAYELALYHQGSSARLHNYYGEMLYDAYGDFAAAIKEWNMASMLDPKLSGPYNNLGLHYFHSGEYQLGLDQLDRALKLDPKNPDYLYNMAQVCLIHTPQIADIRNWKQNKVYYAAMKASRKAAELAPDDYELVVDYAVNFFAAERYQARVRWKTAAKAWQAARPLARNADETFYTWLNEARVWIAAEKKEPARACLSEALKLRSQSEVAQELLRRLSVEEKSKKP